MITAKDIINAYKVSGIKPINHKTTHIDENGKFCGCALTALYVCYHGILPADCTEHGINSYVADWAIKYFGMVEASGVVAGFDACDRVYVGKNLSKYQKQRNEASLAAKKLGLN